MSAVDVLAVMDMLADHLSDIASGAESRGMVKVQAKREVELAQYAEARFAVAELIEATQSLFDDSSTKNIVANRKRLRAALARVRGDA